MVQNLTARFGGYLGNLIGASPGLAQFRATNQSSHLEVEQPTEQRYPGGSCSIHLRLSKNVP